MRRLGREKRFVDAVHNLRRHPGARVRHGPDDPVSGVHLEERRRLPLLQAQVGQPDAQFSSVRHGIPGVDRQIGEHLLELGLVALNNVA